MVPTVLNILYSHIIYADVVLVLSMTQPPYSILYYIGLGVQSHYVVHTDAILVLSMTQARHNHHAEYTVQSH